MALTKSVRVLVVPGTTQIGLEVLRSLRALRGISVYGAGIDPDYGHDMGFERFSFLPYSTDGSFLGALAQLCRDWRVNFVYPAHDQVIFDLRDHSTLDVARLVSHPPETVAVCRSKHRTYQELGGLDLTPEVFQSMREVGRYPIFVKPSEGQGSVGALSVESREHLCELIAESGMTEDHFFSHFVVSERLKSDEVTVDCFSSATEGLQFAAARRRVAIQGGISVHTESFDSDELDVIALRISSRLRFSGAWFFQAMRNDRGEFRVTEIATRLAGSSGIRRAQGVNLAHLTLLNAMEIPVAVLKQQGARYSRRIAEDVFLNAPSFDRIYVDYDDTLVRNERPNAELIGFLVAARSKGLSVILITRHKGDLVGELESRGIPSVFDGIVHILDGTPKSLYVEAPNGALFIDDSFSERRDVASLRGVLALDSSAFPGIWGFLRDK